MKISSLLPSVPLPQTLAFLGDSFKTTPWLIEIYHSLTYVLKNYSGIKENSVEKWIILYFYGHIFERSYFILHPPLLQFIDPNGTILLVWSRIMGICFHNCILCRVNSLSRCLHCYFREQVWVPESQIWREGTMLVKLKP